MGDVTKQSKDEKEVRSHMADSEMRTLFSDEDLRDSQFTMDGRRMVRGKDGKEYIVPTTLFIEHVVARKGFLKSREKWAGIAAFWLTALFTGALAAKAWKTEIVHLWKALT